MAEPLDPALYRRPDAKNQAGDLEQAHRQAGATEYSFPRALDDHADRPPGHA